MMTTTQNLTRILKSEQRKDIIQALNSLDSIGYDIMANEYLNFSSKLLILKGLEYAYEEEVKIRSAFLEETENVGFFKGE